MIINQLDKMAEKNHLVNKRRAPIKRRLQIKARAHWAKFEINAGGVQSRKYSTPVVYNVSTRK